VIDITWIEANMGDVEARRPSAVDVMEANDEHRLAELGYRQDLKREWSLIHNFGVSFSIIV
jgi:hypothetical protein